jgi:GntR family transcriptional regulator, transcriptional repressor for pyruvate dehydrogenase complex
MGIRTTGQPAYQSLADGLRAQITSGRLRPGDRLPTEPQLCAQSGLSRSTVREALRLLTSQHLIVTTRGVTGGSFVAEPSPLKLAETLESGLGMLIANGNLQGAHLIEVRAMLEVPAAELAATLRTDAHLAELAAAQFDPADEVDHILQVIREFHTTMAAAAGNPLLLLICQALYASANERELTLEAPEGYLPRVDAEHREILAAVQAGDAPRAAAATRAHLEHLRATFEHSQLQL